MCNAAPPSAPSSSLRVVTSLRSFGTAGGGRARGRGARSEAWRSRSSWPWLSSGKPRHRDSAKVSHSEEPHFPNTRLGHKAQTPRRPAQCTSCCLSRTRLETPRRPQKTPKAKKHPGTSQSRPSCSSWGAAPPSFSPDFLGGAFPLAQPPRRLSPGFPNAPWVSKRPPRLHSRPPRRQHQPRGEPHSAQSPPRGGRRGRASPLSSPRPPARCLPP